MVQRDESILVTGAGGFIGAWLVRKLLEDGHGRVRAVDIKPMERWYQVSGEAENLVLDLREAEACQRAARDMRHVFNLAADMGGMGFIETHKAECMVSVLINTNMLLAARDHGIDRYFYSSSACAYNVDKQRTTDDVALREDDAYPAMPEDGYGWEKLFSERMCRHFREDYGIATRVARYHNVYGPFGSYDDGREKAPAAICRKVAQAKMSGDHRIEIWGDGEQTRSFMFIDDCVRGTREILDGAHVDPINLGSARMVTINQLVDIVERIAGVKLERSYKLDAPKGVRGRSSDNTLFRQVYGWEPEISLEDGLQATYRWIHDRLVERGQQRQSA
jgi:GDP-D-mannose 3',5'-epimerase